MAKTSVTIFSGYLGSGKTTIIMNALRQYKTPPHFAMIKNEYGDASVDGALAQMNNLAVKELVNGCLCCILVGSLNDAIDELIEKQHPERILIEASGNALPFPIILELKKNTHVFVDGVISVVDCVNFEKVKDTSYVAREQAKHTDLIIFNKTHLVDEDKLYRVKEAIFGINPDTTKVDLTDGVINPDILFGIDHIDQLDGEHVHDEGMETFVFETDKQMDKVKVEAVLAACKPQSFFRIKGIINCLDNKTYLVNSVFGKTTIDTLDISYETSRIIFIGMNISRHKEMIYDYLNQSTRA